jgi:hypothetical protein
VRTQSVQRAGSRYRPWAELLRTFIIAESTEPTAGVQPATAYFKTLVVRCQHPTETSPQRELFEEQTRREMRRRDRWRPLAGGSHVNRANDPSSIEGT